MDTVSCAETGPRQGLSGRLRLLLTVLIGSAGLVAVLAGVRVHSGSFPAALAAAPQAMRAAPGHGYIFRFDPSLQQFEAFTLPTSFAKPHSVVAVASGGAQHVWFTEPGVDRVGRLVYTGTGQYTLHEYDTGAGSAPLNVAARPGGPVWFTAPALNRLGRITPSSGAIDMFDVPTAGSWPAHLALDSTGNVWFSEMEADRLGHLIVTSTHYYRVDEYHAPGSNLGLYGLAMDTDAYVWFTESKPGVIGRLKVSNGSFLWASLNNPAALPHEILLDQARGYLWYTLPGSNQLGQLEVGTLYVANTYSLPEGSRSPTGLAMTSGNRFWMSARDSGQLCSMVYTNPVNVRFDVFALPVEGLWAWDVASDSSGALWLTAYRPWNVYLPLVVRAF